MLEAVAIFGKTLIGNQNFIIIMIAGLTKYFTIELLIIWKRCINASRSNFLFSPRPPNNCAFFDCSMLHSLSTFKLHSSHFSATYYVVFYVLLLALTLLAAIVLVPWYSWRRSIFKLSKTDSCSAVLCFEWVWTQLRNLLLDL